MVGEGRVAPVPVGRHVATRHIRHLLGQGGGGQDGQRPQQQVLTVLIKENYLSKIGTEEENICFTSFGF